MLKQNDLVVGESYDITIDYRAGIILHLEFIDRYDVTNSASGISYTVLIFRDINLVSITIPVDRVGFRDVYEIFKSGVGSFVRDVNCYVTTIKKVDNRIRVLRDSGYSVEIRRMGPGGVGVVKKVRNEIRMQIAAAHTKWGSAYCVVIPINKK